MSTLPAPADLPPATAGHPPFRAARWARRMGAAAFLFFLIKGLAWLTVPPLLILAARLMGE